VVPAQQSTSCMRSTSCLLFDANMLLAGAVVVAAYTVCFRGGLLLDANVLLASAVVVAASTVCFRGGSTGICQTAPFFIIVSTWPPGARIFPVW